MTSPILVHKPDDIFDSQQQSYTHEYLSGFTWGGLLGLLVAAVYFTPLLIEILERNSITAQTIIRYPLVQKMIGLTRSSFSGRALGLRSAPDGSGNGEHNQFLKNVFGVGKSAVSAARGLSPDGAPKGLGNWDNSCYQNSVLQAFASLQLMRQFYDQVTNGVKTHDSSSTFAALMDLTEELNDTRPSSRYIWTPQKLKNMSSWQQQDAQEYLSKLVDEIERDVKASLASSEGAVVKSPSHSANSAMRLGLAALVDSQRLAATSAMSNQTAQAQRIQNPLEGLLAQRVGCTTCGYSDGVSLIPFTSLTLPLGKNWLYDIEGCLNEFTSLEFIEGVECSKCTLLQARRKLREFLENLEADEDENQSGIDEDDEQTARLRSQAESQLNAITEAILDDDFSDATLKEKCRIPNKFRTTSTKSRQAIVMRTPQCLILHVNRSVFDEMTGEQRKNYAEVRYPSHLDLDPWIVGSKVQVGLDPSQSVIERWEMNPSKSMNEDQEAFARPKSVSYQLRAVITHYGRHENGHYICYRSLPKPSDAKDEYNQASDSTEESSQWWRISDENAYPVSDEDAHSQGGAFMLFYERTEQSRTTLPQDLTTVSSKNSLETAVEAPIDDTIVNPSSAQHSHAVGNSASSEGGELSDQRMNSEEVMALGDEPSPKARLNINDRAQRDLSPRHVKLESIPLRTATPHKDSHEEREHFQPVHMVATT